MLERHDIDRALSPVLELIAEYQAAVRKIQAKAAAQIFADENRRLLIEINANAEIRRITARYQQKIEQAIARTTAGLIEADLSAQIELYRRAFKAGLVETAPVIPAKLAAASTLVIAREAAFANDLLSRTMAQGGNNLARIVSNGLAKKLGGMPLGRVVLDIAADIRATGTEIMFPVSGRRVRDIEAYARMQMISSVGKASAEAQIELYRGIDVKEGLKGFATSAHMGARPTHEPWQGKVFYDWTTFVAATGYGEVWGLCGANCRHTFYPFIKGVSESLPAFDKEANDERYRQMQEQRYNERMIRQWKTEAALLTEMRPLAAEAAALEQISQRIAFTNAKVGYWQARQRALINETGLTRQYIREQIAA